MEGSLLADYYKALLSPFLRSTHTQRVWLSMARVCLHLANTLPRVCEKLPIDDAGGEQKGVSGRKVALPEDALRQEKERARCARPTDGKSGRVNPCRL